MARRYAEGGKGGALCKDDACGGVCACVASAVAPTIVGVNLGKTGKYAMGALRCGGCGGFLYLLGNAGVNGFSRVFLFAHSRKTSVGVKILIKALGGGGSGLGASTFKLNKVIVR